MFCGDRENGEKTWLNVGAWMERSVANGPGERFVLWLQGCPLRCPGCFNPEFLPFVPRHRLEVGELAGKILAVTGLEGVTYTGGEPMVQARGLALLSQRLRDAGLTVVCYTGYTLEELEARADFWIQRLLLTVDILIDGPFLVEQAASLPWRGSRNQRVHFLTDTYRHLAGWMERRPAEVEFSVGAEGFAATGTWPQEFWQRLQRLLQQGVDGGA